MKSALNRPINRPKLKAILFDLDNTLLLFDEAQFYQGYFRSIEKVFADLMPKDIFMERLIGAVRTLMQNNGEMTNAEYFKDVFAQGFMDKRDKLWDRFLYFYDTEYDKLEINFTLPKDLHETMEAILQTGLKLVLASNPIFPLNVQMKRLTWAGLDYFPFDMITHLENMSFCKPRIEYYLEICQKIKQPPETCLMVGNDALNDMIAALTGMKTYLTNDSHDSWKVKIDVDEVLQGLQLAAIPEPDFNGPLLELPGVVQQYLEK